jgi:hypothetical protein
MTAPRASGRRRNGRNGRSRLAVFFIGAACGAAAMAAMTTAPAPPGVAASTAAAADPQGAEPVAAPAPHPLPVDRSDRRRGVEPQRAPHRRQGAAEPAHATLAPKAAMAGTSTRGGPPGTEVLSLLAAHSEALSSCLRTQRGSLPAWMEVDAQGAVVSVRFDGRLPEGEAGCARRALVGLPVGGRPGETLYVEFALP